MYPSVSIVSPSLNQGKFIERTIKSVLDQKIPNLEYVVTDGQSSDETIDILKKYNNRLKWVSEKDTGQTNALNKGIRMTTGEVIGWLNTDDIYYPQTLQYVLDYFLKNPDVLIVYGNANHIDADDNIIEPYYTEDWDYERLKDVCFICQPSVFFRRKLIERIGYPDESLTYCMDYEYWLRIGGAGVPFFRLDKTIAGSRMYNENKTLGSRVPVHYEINDMLLKRIHTVPGKWIYAYAHAVVDEKNLNRSDRKQNLKYVMLLIFHATLGFVRWRRMISLSDVRIMTAWTVGAFRSLKEIHIQA